MIKTVFILLILTAGAVSGRAQTSDLYATIGQPTIFWHNGEWQVFQDGRWIPYTATRTAPQVEAPRSPEPLAPPEPEITNGVYYDWGYGFPLLRPIHHRHPFDKERRFKKDSGAKSLTESAVGNLGRATIGIGKQSGGIGQTTIGIGQPNAGIGQTTIGIGQPTIGIGKSTIGIGQQAHAVVTRSHAHGEHAESHR